MPDSPVPPRRAGLSVTVSPGPAGAPDAGPAPAVAERPESPEKPGDSSGTPEEPVKSSVVSLTRGPSQGAGVDRACGRSTRCHGPANSAGPGTAISVVPL